MECAKINECVLDVFSDDGDITVTVTGMTRDGKADSGRVDWAPTDDDNVKLIGMSSTWDAEADTPAHSSVTVMLKAVDMNGLETEASVIVNIDEAPKWTEVGMGYDGMSYNIDGMLTLTTDVEGWFMDAEGATLTYTGTSENANIANITAGADDVLTDGDVIITGVSLNQSTSIKVAATESGGLTQKSDEIEFTVTVDKVG